RLDPLDAIVDLERVGPRGAEDGAAARQDAADLRDAERLREALQRALPAVAESDELVTVSGDALADHRPDHRVETGAVAATGEHADTHVCSSSLIGLRDADSPTSPRERTVGS